MRRFAEEFFVEESSVRFFGARLQTRMAAIRLPGRRLFLYSPLPSTPQLRRSIDELGEVAFIVSPNKIHNLTLADHRLAYPEAKLFLPPGLPERRPDLAFDAVLSPAPVRDWSPELEHVLTGGNVFFSEALFFHRATETLLVGDFVERIGPGIASRFARSLARLFGVRAHPMASPEFRYFTNDAEAFAATLEAVLRWPIERVFLCHGELIARGGREVVERVGESLLREVRGRGAASRRIFERLAALQ